MGVRLGLEISINPTIIPKIADIIFIHVLEKPEFFKSREIAI